MSIGKTSGGCSLLVLLLIFVRNFNGVLSQGNGAVRLVQNNRQTSLNRGVLEIYIDGSWGSVCRWGDKTTFGKVEADVACYQLGWNGAIGLEFSSNLVGTLQPVISDVQCRSSKLSTLLQCSYNTNRTNIGLNSKCNNGSSVVPICNATTLWSNAYNGMIRLQDGRYVTDGRIEIYCNGAWGTVCDNGFNKNAADTICRELGYTSALSYIDNTIPASDDTPIWLVSVSCPVIESCLSDCHQCPSEKNSDCFHTDDTTLTCTYNTTDRPVHSEVFMCKDDSLLTTLELLFISIGAGVFLSLLVACCIVSITVLVCCKRKRVCCFKRRVEEEFIEEEEEEEDFHELQN